MITKYKLIAFTAYSYWECYLSNECSWLLALFTSLIIKMLHGALTSVYCLLWTLQDHCWIPTAQHNSSAFYACSMCSVFSKWMNYPAVTVIEWLPQRGPDEQHTFSVKKWLGLKGDGSAVKITEYSPKRCKFNFQHSHSGT